MTGANAEGGRDRLEEDYHNEDEYGFRFIDQKEQDKEAEAGAEVEPDDDSKEVADAMEKAVAVG